MRKNDLTAMLERIEGNPEIILQKDSEGNGYSPLSGADGDCVYVPIVLGRGRCILRHGLLKMLIWKTMSGRKPYLKNVVLFYTLSISHATRSS